MKKSLNFFISFTKFIIYFECNEIIIFFRYDDKYNLVLTCRDGKSGAVREATMIKSVANFFDENGVLITELLEPEVSKLHNSLLVERKDK